MVAPVYEQNKQFKRFQSIVCSYCPIFILVILAVICTVSLVCDDLTWSLKSKDGLTWGRFAFLFLFSVAGFYITLLLVYHHIAKRILIANLSRLFQQISKSNNELLVAVARGKYSLFSRDQFAKEVNRVRRSGVIHPLVYEEVWVEFIKSIEAYDFRNAEHRACLEIYLKNLQEHIGRLEAQPAKIAQRIAEVKAEEERYRGYLVGQPAC